MRTILTFKTTRQVIKADALLQHHQIISRIIPVPEHISSECGMCIETNAENTQLIQNILNNNHIDYQSNETAGYQDQIYSIICAIHKLCGFGFYVNHSLYYVESGFYAVGIGATRMDFTIICYI